MKYKSKISILLVFMLLALGLSSVIGIGDQKTNATPTNFITRSGDKLMDGTSEFRFVSFDIPTIQMNEDEVYKWPDPWEQEDAIKSVAQAGGTAFRIWGHSVYETSPVGGRNLFLVTGVRTYNETGLRALDKVLQLANQYNVRVSMGFLNTGGVWGGTKAFAALEGKTESQFCTDATVIADYKDFISTLVNRTNYYTGVQYKNDKAIMDWETLGESNCGSTFTNTIASYIKSIDTNHLVMDGNFGIDSASLTNSNVDIVSDHYYFYSDFKAQLISDRNLSKNYKPFVVGEFGFKPTADFTAFLDELVSGGTTGALIWGLKPHRLDGGFFWHSEGNGYSDYHWPGFASGNSYDETNVMATIKSHAYAIRGLSVPGMTTPDVPTLLSAANCVISWRGSAGASSYDIERATSSSGPWTVVGADVNDAVTANQAQWSDSSAVSATNYYYRIKAKNSGGTSAASNVIGPVTVTSTTVVDDLNDWSKTYSHTSNLILDGSNSQYLGGDTSRAARSTSTYENIIYSSGSSNTMNSFSTDTWFWPYEAFVDFNIYTSPDNSTYTTFTPTKTTCTTCSTWTKVTYSGNLPAGTKYLKIEYRNTSANSWNPQIGSTTYTYSSVSSITDDLNDWSKTFSHSTNLVLDGTNSQYLAGDISRAVRSTSTYENIVYFSGSSKTMTSFSADTWFWPFEALVDFILYTSPDNSTYTTFTPTKSTCTTCSTWTKVTYSGNLPAGTKYVKIEYRNTSANSWNPQVGSVNYSIQ